MARGRLICSCLSTSEKRARLHAVAGPLAEFAQAMYPLLLAHADDWGRQPGDAFTVKHKIDPTSPRTLEEFETALSALATVGLVVLYEVAGRRYMHICGFDEHQGKAYIGKRTEDSSRFPEPPGISGNPLENPSKEKGREEKGREQKRTEEKGSDASPPPLAIELSLEQATTVAPVLPYSGPQRRPRVGLMRGPDPRCYRDAPGQLGVPQNWHNEQVEFRTARGMSFSAAVAEMDAFYERWIVAYTTGERRQSNAEKDRFAFWKARHAEQWPPAGRNEPRAAPGPSVPDVETTRRKLQELGA